MKTKGEYSLEDIEDFKEQSSQNTEQINTFKEEEHTEL